MKSQENTGEFPYQMFPPRPKCSISERGNTVGEN